MNVQKWMALGALMCHLTWFLARVSNQVDKRIPSAEHAFVSLVSLCMENVNLSIYVALAEFKSTRHPTRHDMDEGLSLCFFFLHESVWTSNSKYKHIECHRTERRGRSRSRRRRWKKYSIGICQHLVRPVGTFGLHRNIFMGMATSTQHSTRLDYRQPEREELTRKWVRCRRRI